MILLLLEKAARVRVAEDAPVGSGARLVLGVVLAFVALVVSACGGPGESEPRPLPEDQRALLRPGEYRSEVFEPSFSFVVGEGWTTSPPEVYDALRITRGHEMSWTGRIARLPVARSAQKGALSPVLCRLTGP